MRWLLGLLFAGAALGLVESRTGWMRKGLHRAKDRVPKDRLPKDIQDLMFRQARQPWWKIG